MVARALLGLVSLVILAGGILLQFFIILSGAIEHGPINKFYFLQTTTNGISGAVNPARWTFFSICGVVNGVNGNCGPVKAALPFDPPRNFGTTNNIPMQFIGTTKYYYLSRFMFAFFLIALFFAVIALLTSVLALCTRLGAYLTGLSTMIALFFQTLAAALMTAWTVLGERAFNANGQTANLGRYAYGFTWASVACFFISTVLFCLGGSLSKDSSSGSGGRFGRRKNKSTRGSFVDGENGHRVKDEYD